MGDELKEQNRNLLVILLIVWLGFVGFSMPYPVLTSLLLDEGGMLAGWSETQRPIMVGIVLSAFAIGQLFGSPILGKKSDKYGRKPVLLLSLTGTIIGYLITAFSVLSMNLIFLIIGRIVTGLCEGNIAISNAIAADISDKATKTKVFTYISMAINLAWIVGPLAGGMLADNKIHPAFGYDIPFWVGAALSVITFLTVLFLFRETRVINNNSEQKLASESPSNMSLVKMPVLRQAFAISFFSILAIFTFYEYFAFYYIEKFDFIPSQIAFYSALLSIPIILGGLAVPKLSKKLSIRSLNSLGISCVFVGLFIYSFVPTQIWTFLPMAMTGVGIAILFISTALAVSNSVNSDIQGQAMGLYRSINVIGEILAAILGGFLASMGTTMPFIGAAFIGLFALFIVRISKHSSFMEIAKAEDY